MNNAQELENALMLISDATVKMAKQTKRLAPVVLDSNGKFWYANKYWSVEELSKELDSII